MVRALFLAQSEKDRHEVESTYPRTDSHLRARFFLFQDTINKKDQKGNFPIYLPVLLNFVAKLVNSDKF